MYVFIYLFIYYICIMIPHENYFMLSIQVCWDITLCQLVNNYQYLKGHNSFIFMVMQGNYLPLGMM
jgi:hypothetical protein